MLPYQEHLSEQLKAVVGDVLVVAPTGSGTRNSVVAVIGEWVRQGPVLVLADRLSAADQWAWRLAEIGEPCAVLRTTDDVIASMDGGSPAVVVATLQRLRAGIGRKYAYTVAPRTVILDCGSSIGPAGQELIHTLRSHGARLIVLSGSAAPRLWFDPAAVLRVPLRVVLAARQQGPFQLRVVTYDVPDSVREVLNRGRAALKGAGLRQGAVGVQGLHADLLNLITAQERPIATLESYDEEDSNDAVEDLSSGASAVQQRTDVQELWRIVDALENLPEDPRLSATVRLAAEAHLDGRGCVIVTRLPLEGEALAAVIGGLGIACQVVNSRVRSQDRVVHEGAAGQAVLVVTQPMMEALIAPMQRPRCILWSASNQASRLSDVMIWTAIRGGELALVVGSEPTAEESGLMRTVEFLAASIQDAEYFG